MSDRSVTDEDIRHFLRTNWQVYPSQIMLMQAAVQRIWPEGPPSDGGESVVRICLEENNLVMAHGSQLLLCPSSSE